MTTRPIPCPDERSQPFFDAAKSRRLLIKRCESCSRYLAPDLENCDDCLSASLEWTEASGLGAVYSFVIMHQLTHPGFTDEVPYNIAYVELDEGPRLKTNIVGTPNESIEVGMRVRVTFEDLNHEVTVPKFQPVPPST